MTAREQNHDVIVGRLRVAGRQVDPIEGKMRFARILAEASLQPTLPSPSAVLVVRRARDPLPGGLCMNGSDVQKPHRWERAFSAALDQFVRSAARPALGPVPASAESVVFLDRSELLACLASDWCDGSAILHWWWQSVFRATDVTSAVVAEWLGSIEYVPAAFAKLAQKGNAIRFAGSMPDGAVSRLLDKITRNFGLTDLRIALSLSKIESQPRAIGQSDQSERPRNKPAELLLSRELSELRTRLAPEAFAPGLKMNARVLLAAALMLERAPVVLRQRSFTGRLMSSLLGTEASEVIDAPGVIERSQSAVASAIERSQRELELESEQSASSEINRTEQQITHPADGGETPTAGLRATTPSDEKPRSDYRAQQDGPRAQIEGKRKPEAVRAGPGDLPVALEPDTWNHESVAPPLGVSTMVGEHPPADLRATEKLQATEELRVIEKTGASEEMPASGELRATEKVQATEELRAIEKTGALEAMPASGKLPTNEDVRATRELRPTGELRAIKTTGAMPANEELRTTLVHQSKVSAAAIEVACETKLGGIFYLINAALALNLYSDFTRPLEPGIELSIWDFLALTGRELKGKQIESDPIWALLAALAGRDQREQPGSHFNAPEEWRMPPGWLEALPKPGEWSYQTSRGRLIVRHPDNFTVLSVKLGPRFRARDIAARLASETSCYADVATFSRRRLVRDGFGLRGRERRLERWTRWIAEYLRARLARAVGIAPAVELVATMFSSAARVEVTPARLDVFFSLAELPVEVRLSGLDRDPGWVPAAGRYIAFHFE